MRYLVRRFYSGYCEYEIEAENEDIAYENSKQKEILSNQILFTLVEWKECDEVYPIRDN